MLEIGILHHKFEQCIFGEIGNILSHRSSIFEGQNIDLQRSAHNSRCAYIPRVNKGNKVNRSTGYKLEISCIICISRDRIASKNKLSKLLETKYL